MPDYLTQYYRCPERYVRFALRGSLSKESGYFRFGAETLYGGYCGQRPSNSPTEPLRDAYLDTTIQDGWVFLPFDYAQAIESLRCELYTAGSPPEGSTIESLLKRMYYCARPLLPVAVRKHLQKLHANGWQKIAFPQWPVDRTVDDVFERLLVLSLKSSGVRRIPFIWFWPDGASSCAIMTHDVETRRGRDACTALMDIDDAAGISASFQLVPESRYQVTPKFLESITSRGFTIGIQDLNHDGRLYSNRRQFLARAARINAYGRQWGAEGFRAAVLYRKQEWFDALDFSYDMSVPNVAHLDPQRGGCCTIMPHFIGKILELPVTTTQDYTLFHILNDYSTTLWKRQIEMIMEKHGLINFIVHPDYITGLRERNVYQDLLAHLAQLRQEKDVWIAKPDEVDHWWRQRASMVIIEDENGLRIQGPGSERAHIAFASEEDDRLVLTLQPPTGVNEVAQLGECDNVAYRCWVT